MTHQNDLRITSIEYHEDGTLKSFSASTILVGGTPPRRPPRYGVTICRVHGVDYDHLLSAIGGGATGRCESECREDKFWLEDGNKL